MFKQYPHGHLRHFLTHLNLHMKGDNISKEFYFKFNRKVVSALCTICQRTALILHLKAIQLEEDPFVGVIEFGVFIRWWKIQQHTQEL